MQRPWLKTAAAALAVALLAALSARAADAPYAGNWKLVDLSAGNESALALLQLDEKDGKYTAKVLASPGLGEGVTVENVKADAKSIAFDVKFAGGSLHVKAYPTKTKEVLGAIQFNNRYILTQLVKTDDKELDPASVRVQTDEGKALAKTFRITDVKEKRTALQELVEKNPGKSVAYFAGFQLLQTYLKDAPEDKEIRAAAEQLVKNAAVYGPEVEGNALLTVAQTLSRADKVSPVAVEFAQKAEKALTKDDNASHSLAVVKTLRTVLKKSGKEDDAKQLDARIEKLDLAADAEFEKTAVPFKPTAYKGRRGDSKRVSVVELFTGAYCPPCVAADIAFDAALHSYKPQDVVMIQYHTHIPAPDRLTNEDTEARLKYYGKDVRGVPTAFLNGKQTKALGGGKGGGEKSFESLRDAINDALETEATAALKLNVERKGDKIDITADVSDLKKPGEKVKLRFVLIQEVVRYPGGNGQRLHHHVVRALPGGADGFALTEEKSKQNASINVADLKKSLDEYLTKYNEGPRKFLDDENPLNIKDLKVIALIQDDDSKEILQAVQMDVPDGK